MSLAARCPGCGTVFRVRADQLQAYHGQVRCGRCSRVFNAFETLEALSAAPRAAQAAEDPYSAQPPSPPEATASPTAPTPPESEFVPGSVAEGRDEGGDAPLPQPEPQEAVPEPEQAAAADAEEPISIPENAPMGLDLSDVMAPAVLRPGRREHPSPLAHVAEADEPRARQPAAVEEPAAASAPTPETPPRQPTVRPAFAPVPLEEEAEPPRRTWAWVLGSLLLLATLGAQLGYLFRADIAAQLPGARPWLEEACAWAGCSVSLPRRIDRVLIESSDLRAEGQPASVMTLMATMRNYAAHSQAYPHLELTLTDTRDEPIARRVFAPGDYLGASAALAEGMVPNRPVDVRLLLDSGDLQPAGYRLFVFYP